MERLSRKFKTAASYVPPALIKTAGKANGNTLGIIYYGSTSPAMDEAFEQLKAAGVNANGLRIRAFPFGSEVADFVSTHEQLIIVEQNRDGQLRSLLINELEINPADLIRVLHYDGTPITANFITKAILSYVDPVVESDVAQVASN